MRSRRARIGGMAWVWMGVGSVNPKSATARTTGSDSPSAANAFFSFMAWRPARPTKGGYLWFGTPRGPGAERRLVAAASLLLAGEVERAGGPPLAGVPADGLVERQGPERHLARERLGDREPAAGLDAREPLDVLDLPLPHGDGGQALNALALGRRNRDRRLHVGQVDVLCRARLVDDLDGHAEGLEAPDDHIAHGG